MLTNNKSINTFIIAYFIINCIALFVTAVFITAEYTYNNTNYNNNFIHKTNNIKQHIYSCVNKHIIPYYLVLFTLLILYVIFAGLLMMLHILFTLIIWMVTGLMDFWKSVIECIKPPPLSQPVPPQENV